jgi:hypothetical protein
MLSQKEIVDFVKAAQDDMNRKSIPDVVAKWICDMANHPYAPEFVTIPWPLPPLEIEPPPPRNRKLEKTHFKKFERRVS